MLPTIIAAKEGKLEFIVYVCMYAHIYAVILIFSVIYSATRSYFFRKRGGI